MFVYTACGRERRPGDPVRAREQHPTKPLALLPATGNGADVLDEVDRARRGCGRRRRAPSTVSRSSRACWPAIRFSRRSSIHFTGRPRRLPASTTASSSGSMNIFCPNPPPTSLHDDPDLVLRAARRARDEEAAHAVRALGRTPRRSSSRKGSQSPRRRGLHRHASGGAAERLGDDVGGRRRRRVELGVVAGRDRRRRRCRSRSGCTSRAPVGQRRVVVDDRRERLDLDLDELAGVLGQVPRLGHDERDGSPTKRTSPSASTRNGRPPVAALESTQASPTSRVEVGAGEHRDHAGQLAGRRDVERGDRAAATSLRTNAACSMPGTTTSST